MPDTQKTRGTDQPFAFSLAKYTIAPIWSAQKEGPYEPPARQSVKTSRGMKEVLTKGWEWQKIGTD